MSTQSHLYTHTRWLAPRTPATPDEAQTLAKLADAAMQTAREFGVECSRREALLRARENLAWAHQAVWDGGVAESEWMA